MSIFQIEEQVILNSWGEMINHPNYTSPVKPKKFN